MESILGHLVYSRRMLTLPEIIQELMVKQKLTLAVAEACTSGLLGARFTDAAGSSEFFRGGFLVYADEVAGFYMEELGFSAMNPQQAPCFIFTVNI